MPNLHQEQRSKNLCYARSLHSNWRSYIAAGRILEPEDGPVHPGQDTSTLVQCI